MTRAIFSSSVSSGLPKADGADDGPFDGLEIDKDAERFLGDEGDSNPLF